MDFTYEGEGMQLMLKQSLLSRNKLATISKDLDGVTRFTCIECNAEFEDKEELEIHLCSHFKVYRFVCDICGAGLKRREHLERHQQGHMEVRPHTCDECGKAFKRKEHLNIHKSIHIGVKSLQCSICDKSFYRKDHLQKHIQTHNKHFIEQNIIPMSDQELSIKEEVDDFDDIKPIITEVTGNVTDHDFSSMESDEHNLLQPMEDQSFLTESRNPRPFVCDTCGKSYKRKDHLKIHSWTHAKKEVACPHCGKEFHMKEQMLVHVNMVHLKTYVQPNHSLSQLQSLLGTGIEVELLSNQPHLVPRKVKEERAHECHICHRKFKRKQHLKVHANVHLKKRNTFFCGSCHEGFSDNILYQNHKCPRTEYIENGDMEEAEAEGVEDSYEQNTEYHNGTSPNGDARKENYPQDLLEVVVEEAILPRPQRVFVCKFCEKPFRRKDHYKIHLHIHTGLKSFFCPTCNKGFYRKDHLQKHMIVHAKNKIKAKTPTKPQKELRPPPPFEQVTLSGTPVTSHKKQIPGLLPLAIPKKDRKDKKDIKPEITIHAPSSAKLRVPLQMKVPYQMVMSLDNGEQRAVTVDPTAPQIQEKIEEDTEILPD